MKNAYKISIIALLLGSLILVLEVFDVVITPQWLSQAIGSMILISLFAVSYIRVHRIVPRYIRR